MKQIQRLLFASFFLVLSTALIVETFGEEIPSSTAIEEAIKRYTDARGGKAQMEATRDFVALFDPKYKNMQLTTEKLKDLNGAIDRILESHKSGLLKDHALRVNLMNLGVVFARAKPEQFGISSAEEMPAAENSVRQSLLPRKVRKANDGKLQPMPGYVWASSDPKDFGVKWKPGTQHSDYPNVIAAEKEQVWSPATGYQWLNNVKDDFRVIRKNTATATPRSSPSDSSSDARAKQAEIDKLKAELEIERLKAELAKSRASPPGGLQPTEDKEHPRVVVGVWKGLGQGNYWRIHEYEYRFGESGGFSFYGVDRRWRNGQWKVVRTEGGEKTIHIQMDEDLAIGKNLSHVLRYRIASDTIIDEKAVGAEGGKSSLVLKRPKN